MIEMVYVPKENNEKDVRIFGEDFVYNNSDKCKIIYKNKEYQLKQFFKDIDNNYNNKDIISFQLDGINHITDMSWLFSECNSLISLPDISKWNTSKLYILP